MADGLKYEDLVEVTDRKAQYVGSSQLGLRFNAVPVDISAGYSVGVDKVTLQWRDERPRKVNGTEEEQGRRPDAAPLETY